MKRRLMTMAALGVFGLLTACATGPASSPPATTPATPAASTGLRVSGTISYLQRIALPPDSEVIVQLRDVSRMDAKADILAEQRFTTRSQVPLPFELIVDPQKSTRARVMPWPHVSSWAANCCLSTTSFTRCSHKARATVSI